MATPDDFQSTSVPGGIGGYQSTYIPPTCSHGVMWAHPCASCGRGYAPATAVVDLTLVVAALTRIEALLGQLLKVGGQEADRAG